MADTLTTLSLVTLAQEYSGDVVRQINRKTSTLRMMKIKRGEGKNVAWAPEFDGAVTENYAEGADAANFGSDTQSSAVLGWALYRSNFHLSSLAMDGSATSSTPEGNRQLWARNLVNAAGKLAAQINTEIFAGTGTGTRMAGLAVAILDSGTYATIDRAATTDWKSTVVAPGALTAPTFALIRDDIRKGYEASGERPDMAVCTPSVFNKIGSLFDATRRQIDNIRGGQGPIKLEFGFNALEVDGTVFFNDKDCTAQVIYYLNSDHCWIEYLPNADQDKLFKASGGVIQANDGEAQVPESFVYEMLAKNGASDKAMVRWTGQLVVDRPNAFVKRTNVLDS